MLDSHALHTTASDEPNIPAPADNSARSRAMWHRPISTWARAAIITAGLTLTGCTSGGGGDSSPPTSTDNSASTNSSASESSPTSRVGTVETLPPVDMGTPPTTIAVDRGADFETELPQIFANFYAALLYYQQDPARASDMQYLEPWVDALFLNRTEMSLANMHAAGQKLVEPDSGELFTDLTVVSAGGKTDDGSGPGGANGTLVVCVTEHFSLTDGSDVLNEPNTTSEYTVTFTNHQDGVLRVAGMSGKPASSC